MTMYKITFSPEAETDLSKLKRSEPACFKKAVKLLNELVEHPKTGTGHPEPLKGKPENRWSRQILSFRASRRISVTSTCIHSLALPEILRRVAPLDDNREERKLCKTPCPPW